MKNHIEITFFDTKNGKISKEKSIQLIPFISRVFELMFSFWIFRSTIYFMFLNFWLTYTWFLFSSSSSDSSSDDSSDDESSSSSSDSSGDESDVNILEEAPPLKVTKPGISPAKEPQSKATKKIDADIPGAICKTCQGNRGRNKLGKPEILLHCVSTLLLFFTNSNDKIFYFMN